MDLYHVFRLSTVAVMGLMCTALRIRFDVFSRALVGPSLDSTAPDTPCGRGMVGGSREGSASGRIRYIGILVPMWRSRRRPHIGSSILGVANSPCGAAFSGVIDHAASKQDANSSDFEGGFYSHPHRIHRTDPSEMRIKTLTAQGR